MKLFRPGHRNAPDAPVCITRSLPRGLAFVGRVPSAHCTFVDRLPAYPTRRGRGCEVERLHCQTIAPLPRARREGPAALVLKVLLVRVHHGRVARRPSRLRELPQCQMEESEVAQPLAAHATRNEVALRSCADANVDRWMPMDMDSMHTRAWTWTWTWTCPCACPCACACAYIFTCPRAAND